MGAPSHCSCPASLMGPARVGRGFLILAKMTVPPPPPPSLQPSRRFNPSFSCFSGCLTSSVLSLTSCPRLLFLHQGGDGNGTQGLRLPLRGCRACKWPVWFLDAQVVKCALSPAGGSLGGLRGEMAALREWLYTDPSLNVPLAGLGSSPTEERSQGRINRLTFKSNPLGRGGPLICLGGQVTNLSGTREWGIQ